MKALFTNLSSKPYKLFFLGGVFNAMLFMALLLLPYLNVLYPQVALSLYHAYALIFAVFTQFFTGFLFTMFPRFLSTPAVERHRYVRIFLLLNAAAVTFALAAFVAKPLAAAAAVGLFAAYVLICRELMAQNAQSEVLNRRDTNWILALFAVGALSNGLFLLALFDSGFPLAARWAVQIGFFLYLFMVVLTLSQKMIPFFTENKVAGYRANVGRYLLPLVFLLLAVKVVLTSLALDRYGFAVDFLLFALTARELIRWRLPLFQVDAMLWVLYLSLLWVPVGFLLFFLDSLGQFLAVGEGIIFERVHLHVLALGYFTTIFVGFGSRIVLGHAGEKPRADAFTIGLFVLVQVLVMVRVAAGLSLNADARLYVDLIIASVLLWLLLFGLWVKRYLRLLQV